MTTDVIWIENMTKFELPPAPTELQEKPVRAWYAPVPIPTYTPLPADKNPMFLEKRVYQGSSGRVYPLPFIDRIAETKADRAWQAIHIENEYVRLMILPELGGRIHVGLDKTNHYDFFYRQNVIKPALVGLAGPWISGGVEFNWPQHHRPSTFMPTETEIESHADGAVTVWCGEHEPMNRMKGMHGVCLRPGSSVVELKVRLFNRTELAQTFLWWANVAVRVHERYQSFFPPDVRYVADHAKRAISRFPLCEGSYYGVDYGQLATRDGHTPTETRAFIPPPGMYAANDLSWYANIPVPTSYMAMGTKEDFFGGYDHARNAGLIHVADHRIAPGKKQWTWGNHPFGYAWDRNLTDDDGPYIELMAGVFTDNQPDFSYLHPGETRRWSQYWYPFQKIGPPQKANLHAAVSLQLSADGKEVVVGVAAPKETRDTKIQLFCKGVLIDETRANLDPGHPHVKRFACSVAGKLSDYRLSVQLSDGAELISYQPEEHHSSDLPPAAREPSLPAQIKTIEELYLIGVHLEQYRHATRMPEAYWLEALKRDPGDSRCNNAMGLCHLRRGEFESAVTYFQTAVATVTAFNPNPRDGEVYYNLGVSLRHLDRLSEAYDAFSKAAWNAPWQVASNLALGQIDARRGEWKKSYEHLQEALRRNPDHADGRVILALVSQELTAQSPAEVAVESTAYDSRKMLQEVLDQYDRMNPAATFLLRNVALSPQMALDVALLFGSAGFYEKAIEALDAADSRAHLNKDHVSPNDGSAPLLAYYGAFFCDKLQRSAAATDARALAAVALPDYCFPARLEEIAILQDAIAKNPKDARAPYYLGNLFYDRRRHAEAIALWETSVRLDPDFSIPWRNLGIAYFNVSRNPAAAKEAYDKAQRANPADARLLYERDQLLKRMGVSPEQRLLQLQKHVELVNRRDDLTVEFCTLLNRTGQHEQALKILAARHFQPWEGGEGLALGQWERTHVALGLQACKANDFPKARQLFDAALRPPANLGEAKHLLANSAEIHYWAGRAAHAAGDESSAQTDWETAASSAGDFQRMSARAYSELSLFSGLALLALGRHAQAKALFEAMLATAAQLRSSPATIDYFATSLPTMLLFEEDLQDAQRRQSNLIEAFARAGLSRDGGDKELARRLLEGVIDQSPDQLLAAELLSALEW